jgi:hypothetical protein
MGYKERAGAHPPSFFAEGVVSEMPGRGLNARIPDTGIGPDHAGLYAVNPQWNGKGFTQGCYVPLVLKTFFPAADIVVYMQTAENERKAAVAGTPGSGNGIPDCAQSGSHGRGIGAARQGREKHRTGILRFTCTKTPVTAKDSKQPILETGTEIFRLNLRH